LKEYAQASPNENCPAETSAGPLRAIPLRVHASLQSFLLLEQGFQFEVAVHLRAVVRLLQPVRNCRVKTRFPVPRQFDPIIDSTRLQKTVEFVKAL
jgi:hypothetical protein